MYMVSLLALVLIAAPVAADTITINAGNSQSATVGTAVAIPPSVLVNTTDGTPVNGASVIFTVTSGGGTVSVETVTTGSNGIATVNWILGSAPGTNTLTVTSASLTPVTFTATGTAAISAPNITSITPTSAVNNGQQTIDIVGTGFSVSAVTLTKDGQSPVTGVATATTDTATTLSRNFNLNGIAAGTWSLVILNTDGGTVTGSFTVNSATASTVTAISPMSGTVNTTVSTTITGTGFVPTSAKIRLYRSGNYIGGSVNSGGTTTQLTGTFNLNQATLGTYDVCVLPDGVETSKICSPIFTILSSAAVNGTINVKSSPTSSKVFLSSNYQGYTPLTLDNIIPGTYTVLVQRAGYNSYSESVKVTAGNTSYVTASLVLAPEETTVTTTVPTTTITTVKTTKKSTAKTPTPWPTDTPTPASPVSIIAILGAVGLGLIVLRKY